MDKKIRRASGTGLGFEKKSARLRRICFIFFMLLEGAWIKKIGAPSEQGLGLKKNVAPSAHLFHFFMLLEGAWIKKIGAPSAQGLGLKKNVSPSAHLFHFFVLGLKKERCAFGAFVSFFCVAGSGLG